MKETLLILERCTFYFLLISMFAYAVSNKRDISILLTLVAVFLGEYCLDLALPLLANIEADIDSKVYRVLWYTLFTLVEVAVITTILQLHKLYHLELVFGARQTIHGYFGLTAIQISLCILSFFLPHHIIVNIHEVAVSSLFLLILGVLLFSVMRDFLPWNISIKLEKSHD